MRMTSKNNKTKENVIIKKNDEKEVEKVVAAHPELDAEVLDALNVKRKKKKPIDAVDYIPELERDEDLD